jgi:hypothetical protein
MLSVLLVLGLAACGDKKGQDVIDDMKKIVAETCKCTDEACLDKVGEMADKMEEGWEKKYPDKDSIPKDVIAQLEKLEGEMKACKRKVRGEQPIP